MTLKLVDTLPCTPEQDTHNAEAQLQQVDNLKLAIDSQHSRTPLSDEELSARARADEDIPPRIEYDDEMSRYGAFDALPTLLVIAAILCLLYYGWPAVLAWVRSGL